ncbi:MAG: glycoside hydrolase family 3 C-terminal domain-containing protein [Terracidiphilus sp.]
MRNNVRNIGLLMIAGSALLAAAGQSRAGDPDNAAKRQVARPWTNRSLSPEQRAALLIKAMTLDEKLTMMHGAAPCVAVWTPKCPLPVKGGYGGYVLPNPRLGIPHLTTSDGRAGVGYKATQVTLLPAPIAVASSWDVDLMNQFGRVLGKEEWGKGVSVTLAPTIDVVRVPEWGRIFETYGEDPYLNGKMAAAEIRGIQSQGSIANANMYLTMNQETDRSRSDSVVDERTLEEIYLPPYAAAVQEGHVGSFMCAYVKLNGVYSCENAQILRTFLRDQIKFDGWVMSDWGATHSTINAVNNGFDQEQPDSAFYGEALKKAVEAGQVSMSTIDEHVHHILVPMFRQGLFDKVQTGMWTSNVRDPKHDAFSRTASEQSSVLLKNERALLPLPATTSIAIIGAAGASKPKAEGGGSSEVVAPYVISPLDGIGRRGKGKVTSADGADLDQAAAVARAADAAIVFVNTNETEGKDRPDLKLPNNQDALISAVAAANKKTIVVLNTGGPVLMPWIDQVAGVIQAWYPGQEDGNAIAAILYGDVNPSAKLPLTFPRTATEIPTATMEQWPGVDGRSQYTEKLNVGYRWYDATNTQPLFPFGFGLSYTTFKVAKLAVDPSTVTLAAPAKVTVKVDVTNTGNRAGAEVVQVYVADPPANGEPPHQLRAFAKVQLKPGETKPVSLMLDRQSFSTYDPATHHWTIRPGTYEILVGTSSRDLPLHRSVTIQ